MASFNRVILVGNLTRDPQVKYLANGTAVCEIGLAVNRTWFDKATNQKKESCDFIDVTLWAKTAEIAGQYLAKGSSILVEGRLQLESWTDKTTNEKRSKLKVIGETMQMLGGKGERAPQSAERQSPPDTLTESFPLEPSSDEIPF